MDAPEAVLAAHVEFIQRRRRRDPDQHLRRERGQARAARGSRRACGELNEAGAKIAREAREVAGRDVLVAGSIGPLGTSVGGVGGDTSSGAALYGEQAALLEGRGVDLIVLETFTSLEELAVGGRRRCGRSADLPVIAQITVQDDGETVTGARGDEVAVARWPGLGVAAVGINCSLGPQSALAGLREMRDAAITAADHPTQHRAAHVPRRPRALSGRVRGLRRRVRRPGGGAGRAADRRLLRHASRITSPRSGARSTSSVPPALRFRGASRAAAPAPPPPPPRAGWRSGWQAGEWVISVELDPPKGANLERLYRSWSHEIHAAGGVEFFDVNDNPMARARMSSLMTSRWCSSTADVETIPHLTPRDTTARGLESQLLGAHAGGIRNVLAVTGDYPPPGDHGGSDAAYQVDAIGLVEIIAAHERAAPTAPARCWTPPPPSWPAWPSTRPPTTSTSSWSGSPARWRRRAASR